MGSKSQHQPVLDTEAPELIDDWDDTAFEISYLLWQVHGEAAAKAIEANPVLWNRAARAYAAGQAAQGRSRLGRAYMLYERLYTAAVPNLDNLLVFDIHADTHGGPPVTPRTIQRWLTCLERAGLIQRRDSHRLLYIVSFEEPGEHQPPHQG